jgi:hypothetical protein
VLRTEFRAGEGAHGHGSEVGAHLELLCIYEMLPAEKQKLITSIDRIKEFQNILTDKSVIPPAICSF